MPLLDPQVSANIGAPQSPTGAIAYRLSRLNLACQDRGQAGRRSEHAFNERLLATYHDQYAAA